MKSKGVPFYSFLITLIILVASRQFMMAQKLAGMTLNGGSLGGGVVYRINADGTQYTDLLDFQFYPQYPKISLGHDGVLYGINNIGGYTGLGAIFSVNPDGTNFKTLFEFGLSMGGYPSSRPIQASDGKLYGTTKYPNFPATLYTINTDGSGFATHNFPMSDDYVGELVEGSDGKLYATTTGGGTNHFGSVISVNKDGSGYSVLYSFDNNNGMVSLAPLIQDAHGYLVGTGPGGVNNKGIVFKIKLDGSSFAKLTDFDGIHGESPRSGLLFGSDGALYGSTSFGGLNSSGVIFTIHPDGSNFTKIFDLNSSDGDYFDQSLQEDSNGFLYGSTTTGGPNHAGIIFKIKTDGSQYQKIYDFENNTNLGQYGGSIVQGNNGLYGVNRFGASQGAGNIFSIQYDGTGYIDLHDFGGPNGFSPYGNLIQGIDSLLYGTTFSGGNSNSGIIFSVDGNGKNYKKLFDFDGLNSGANPYQGLTQASDGYLYGTASNGGTVGSGTIYKIMPDGTGFTKLLDFDDYAGKGMSPFASPLVGLDGKLYGTTYGGGVNNVGTIFSIKTDGTEFTKLFDFSSIDGGSAYSSLVQGNDGTLYGMTASGGTYSTGVIFSISTNGTGYTKLHEFNYQNDQGASPFGSLLFGKDGSLYGTTGYGGSSATGVVFSISADGSNYKKLFDFSSADISNPIGSLIQLDDGTLCGITSMGGANSSGAIYSIHTDGSGFKKIFDYPLAYGTGIMRQNSMIALKLRRQTIHFDAISEVTQGDPSFTLSATASSGLPVSFTSLTSTLAEVDGSSLSILSPGKATIAAAQSGDGIYDQVTTQQSFCIDPLPPSITLAGGGVASVVLSASHSNGYQWFFNNAIIPSATNQTLLIDNPGEYTVQTNVDNCFSRPSDVFLITEIIDQGQDADVSIYPNPAKNAINLNLESFAQGLPVEISIYNMLGQKMDCLNYEGGKVSTLDVSRYPNGNFIITLSQSQKIYHSQFIKY